jgi:hypothetical protein
VTTGRLSIFFVADAHRGDDQRFIVRADEKLTAFVELESAIRNSGEMNCYFDGDPQTRRISCHPAIENLIANRILSD